MKVKNSLVIYILMLFVSISFVAPMVALGQESGVSLPQSYNIQLFKEDQKLSLPANSLSYWFSVQNGTELASDAFLSLHFTFSETLIDRRSNLGIMVNGSPIDTKWIYDLQNTTSGWWRVNIPLSKIKLDGLNEITVQSNQRSIEGDCADIDNPSNWVVIHNDSVMQVTVKKNPDAILSNYYRIYYDNFFNKDVLVNDFILGVNQDINSISALLKLSSSIGKNFRYGDVLDYNVSSGAAATLSNKNKVMIGPVSEWYDISAVKLPDNKLEANQGYLSIANPTNNTSGYNLLITGADQAGVAKAVDFISNNDLLEQVTNKSLAISSPVETEHASMAVNKDGIYKFSDFGYNNINLAGVFHQTANLSFIQPQGIQSTKGSYIKLIFNHSKVLVSDRSLITAYINDVPVNSDKLSLANAESGTLTVPIPAEALKKPIINLKIDCYNYLGLVDCSKDYSDSAWTLISADSKICLIPGQVLIQPTLNNFPYFYTQQTTEKPELLIGLSDFSSPGLLKAASLIATRSGQNTGEVFQWTPFRLGTEITGKQKKRDMIFLGSFDSLNLPEKIKRELPVLPLGKGEFKIIDGLQLIPETLQDKVIFQVIRSPWDVTKRIYVISYASDQDLSILEDILSNRPLLTALDGQVSVIDTNKGIHNLVYTEKTSVSVPKTLANELRKIELLTGMPWWVALLLIIGILAGVIKLLKIRKRKNQFQKVGERIKSEQGFLDEDEKEKEE